jgi:tRNA-specific 2-thiouridylase
MNNGKCKVLVTMSGGVDSAVAAALLKEQGYQVTGVTMKIWDGEALPAEGLHHGCYGPEEETDINDARKVAQNLGIPFQVIDLTKEYQSGVLDYFYQEYLSGRTPNPCVRCNPTIKFGVLVEKARRSGLAFDFIASGHYARVEYDKNRCRYILKKARDLTKDQSYFLSLLSQEQLRRLIFPLGDYTKTEVRKMATHFGLPVANKPESQNFISGDYATMFKTASNPGPILDKEENVLGQHRGIQLYTIGQHKGLWLSTQQPLYVTALDPARNAVIVGTKEDVYGDEFIVSNLNWIAIEEINHPLTLKAKIRSSHKETEVIVTPIDNGDVRVKFREPQLAITPGQATVFYQDDVVTGGGIIKQVSRDITSNI